MLYSQSDREPAVKKGIFHVEHVENALDKCGVLW